MLNFPLCLLNATHISIVYFYVSNICMKGRVGGGGSSGSLLSLCLGEPEDGVLRVFLVLNVMFASPCLLVVYIVCRKYCLYIYKKVAVKVLKKINPRLRFPYRKQNVINAPFRRLLCILNMGISRSFQILLRHFQIKFSVLRINASGFV